MNIADKLVVIISNKQGKCYQVALTEAETAYVKNLIHQMHEGKVKVLPTQLDLIIGKI